MPRPSWIVPLAAISLAAACFAPPALAQGALKPVEAIVVNPASRPVPVSVVPAALGPLVQCRLDLQGSISSTPIVQQFQADPVHSLICPSGVTRLDVQRIVLAPTVAKHRVLLGLARVSSGALVREGVIGSVSDGTPDLALPRALRIDLAASPGLLISADQICSSQMASVPQACGGTVYLIGTAAN